MCCIFRPVFGVRSKFIAFLSFFAEKNAENDYFDHRLDCAAPKRWSKYLTNMPMLDRFLKITRENLFSQPRFEPRTLDMKQVH